MRHETEMTSQIHYEAKDLVKNQEEVRGRELSPLHYLASAIIAGQNKLSRYELHALLDLAIDWSEMSQKEKKDTDRAKILKELGLLKTSLL